ncbi:hypothetical protein PhCBS80983_g03572 [Powellomyces hirtus]|uniref:Uncharacterized protein n=1 Tax=Powellomyces hirtus TaxID=109895 RepID=A0A507E1T8_9FUNG|nr:hypothetical protein PhCBS80983_g03572 [Powellomyces hirtus]
MPERVTLYYSSVSGALQPSGVRSQVKKQTTRVQDILAARKVAYDLVDVAADEDAKEYMQRKSGKNALPQIFVDGEYKGDRMGLQGHDELDEANEIEEVPKWLGLQ